jgi:hypothetical protein
MVLGSLLVMMCYEIIVFIPIVIARGWLRDACCAWTGVAGVDVEHCKMAGNCEGRWVLLGRKIHWLPAVAS